MTVTGAPGFRAAAEELTGLFVVRNPGPQDAAAASFTLGQHLARSRELAHAASGLDHE